MLHNIQYAFPGALLSLCLLVVSTDFAEAQGRKVFRLEGGPFFRFHDAPVDWTMKHCDDGDDCHINIIVDDGRRIVIVNGDTVATSDDWVSDRHHFRGHHPSLDRFLTYWKDDDFDFDLDLDLDLPDLGWLSMDSRLRELEAESRQLARKIRDLEGDERATAMEELESKLGEIFDYKLEKQEARLQKATERMERLRRQRDKRVEARDEIIERRKEELLGVDRYMEW